MPACSSARDRFCAGALAERRFGATVHLLDDGFQHLRAGARRRSALVVSAADERDQPLPRGAAARAARGRPARRRADRPGETPAAARRWRRAGASAMRSPPCRAPAGRARSSRAAAPSACRAIGRSSPSPASPGRSAFFADLDGRRVALADAWRFATTTRSPRPTSPPSPRRVRDDRRRGGPDDREGCRAAAAAAAAAVAAAVVPLAVTIEPADVFTRWLLDRLAAPSDGSRTGPLMASPWRYAPRVPRRRRRRGGACARCRSGPPGARRRRSAGCSTSLDAPHRRVALANLAARLPAQAAGARCRAIARGVFAHFGSLLIELLRSAALPPARMLARSSSTARSGCAHALRRRQGRALHHRALRLLGAACDGPRAAVPADRRVVARRSTTRG